MPYKDPEKRREAVRRHRVRKGLAIGPLDLDPGRPSREDLLRALGVRAREGCVPAMRLLLEEYRRERKP
jgi:hypothetical protein